MKAFGFSVLGIMMVVVTVGVIFTVFTPRSDENQEIAERPDVILGTASRLNFDDSSTL